MELQRREILSHRDYRPGLSREIIIFLDYNANKSYKKIAKKYHVGLFNFYHRSLLRERV